MDVESEAEEEKASSRQSLSRECEYAELGLSDRKSCNNHLASEAIINVPAKSEEESSFCERDLFEPSVNNVYEQLIPGVGNHHAGASPSGHKVQFCSVGSPI